MAFIFQFFNVVYCVDWFVDIKEALNSRDKAHWSWCMIFLMCCWILIARILLRILSSMFISDICRYYLFLSLTSIFRQQFSFILWIPISVQFHHSVVSNSLRPHDLQHARPPCPSHSQSSLKFMSIESVMPSSHLILCRPLLLLLLIPPSIKVFSNESTLRMRWPKY